MKITFTRLRGIDRVFAISGVVSKHWKSVFIFLWFFEINIEWAAKDWMIPSGSYFARGEMYSVYEKNPKYIDEPYRLFVYPPKDYHD